MNEEQIKDAVEAHTPEWLGRCHVIVRDGEADENWLVQIFTDFAETEWVKISGDGDIDVSERVRLDWEFAKKDADEEFMEHIANTLFAALEVDFADLALQPCAPGMEADSLISLMSGGARLLPRDLVRRLLQLAPNAFAGKVDADSTFREEDWFTEWEKDVASEAKEAAPGVELEVLDLSNLNKQIEELEKDE